MSRNRKVLLKRDTMFIGIFGNKDDWIYGEN